MMKQYLRPSFRIIDMESVGFLCNGSSRWVEIPIEEEEEENPSGLNLMGDNEPNLMFK
ncbi:MAG: hypothetical protein MJY52_00980 [Bacteroidaceae bacterium]|nr:hypothetical protein [Bacteroidaceae bacterium]